MGVDRQLRSGGELAHSRHDVQHRSAHLERGLFDTLRLLFAHLSAGRRRALVPIIGLMLLGALAELTTIAALVPFLAMIATPNDSDGLEPVAPLLSLVGGAGSPAAIPLLMSLFAAAALGSAALRLWLLWASNRYVAGVAHELSTKVYSATLNESYQFHIGRNSSEIISMVNKTQLLTSQVLVPLMNASTALVVAIFVAIGLAMVDPGVAIAAAFGFVIIYLTVSVFTRRRLKRNSVIIARTQSERIKAMQDGLGGIRDVLLDQSQAVFVDVFDRAEARYRRASVWNTFFAGAPRFVVEAAGMITIALIAAWVAARPGGLAAAVPVLGALALGAQRLLPLIQQIYGAWASALGNKQIVLDVYELLSRPHAGSAQSGQALQFSKVIELKGITFSYSPDQSPVVREIDLYIPKGARVGLIGKTGSGKSTLMDIVLGLLEPTSGTMSIDGVLLDARNRPAWQLNVAHVPQTIYLADGSLLENIAFGVPHHLVDQKRVDEAVKQAELEEVVAALPMGYLTRVGERGIQLSGGQRQRIGIARALYKRASVLVFDEATSALDTETEAAVMASIRRLGRDLTILIVSHRPSTLDGCDMTLRMEGARGAGSLVVA